MKIQYEEINNTTALIFILKDSSELEKNFLRLLESDIWNISYPDEKLFDINSYLKWSRIFTFADYDYGYCGYYIPMNKILNFYQTYIDECNSSELKILQKLEELKLIKYSVNGKVISNRTFGIILIMEYNCFEFKYKVNNILKHELSHHIYSCNVNYAKSIAKTLRSVNKKYKSKIFNELVRVKKYDNSIIVDEFGAHIIENKELKQFEKLLTKEEKSMINKIVKQYNKNVNNELLTAEYL